MRIACCVCGRLCVCVQAFCAPHCRYAAILRLRACASAGPQPWVLFNACRHVSWRADAAFRGIIQNCAQLTPPARYLLQFEIIKLKNENDYMLRQKKHKKHFCFILQMLQLFL